MILPLPIAQPASPMRRGHRAVNPRRILMVFPRYAPSFGTFQHAYPLMPGVRAFMPPQGLLLLGAYLPRHWSVRFVDENIRSVSPADLAWAQTVFISGMHVQRPRIEAINELAHQAGRLTVLGGPSVSACPEYYPDVDILHLGELGDATDELIARLDVSVERPARQVVLRTAERLPLSDCPCPAYHLVDLRRYFLGSVQFSSGCPFLCEFCDIPSLYGRVPRMKSPRQVVLELECMRRGGLRSAVYFVDDNFIANPAAARELLPHLVDWQRRTGYQLKLACEATLNLAGMADILGLMREANFATVFVGIETPQVDGLNLIQKRQNLRQPIVPAVRAIQSHGIEVVSGIIMGLDTDTEGTADALLDFIDESQIPMLTINLLYALPRTKLHDRLSAAGRISDDPRRPSNVVFRLPEPTVLAMWSRVIREAYEPEALLRRFAAMTELCYPHRLKGPRKVPTSTLRFGLETVGRTLYRVGVRGSFRDEFWRVARPLLRQGRVEEVVHIGIVSHHLVQFARQCSSQQREASFYADPNRGLESAAGAAR
jgi:radical SAM superfamily enzyme YgiQ (UPF0313 family)